MASISSEKPKQDGKYNSDLTHLNSRGEAHMVDVGEKVISSRHARAQATIKMQPTTLTRIMSGDLPKGDVLAVVRTAGIMAAKKTSELIPLCHPLLITRVSIDIEPSGEDTVLIEAEVACSGQTGIEMEALTAASVAALTLYDMCKAIDRGMTIEKIKLLEKAGGRSGHWLREYEDK